MRTLILVMLSGFLIGCGPKIEISALEDTLPGKPIPYQVSIEPSANKIVDIDFAYYPKYRHPSDPIKLTPNKQQEHNRWLGTFEPQGPGEYRLLVRVTYRSALGIVSMGHTTTNAVRDVTVHPALPASCFNFDGGENDFQGWNSTAVFDGRSKTRISKGNCPDLLYLNRSWPFNLDEPADGGSLFIPVSPTCFPKTSTEVSRHGMWRFDLISPDLSDNPSWQNLSGLSYRFATQTMPVRLYALIRYRHDDQLITHTLMPAATYEHYVNAIPGNWRSIHMPVDLPADAKVHNVMIRIMGEPEKTVTPQVGSLFLDGVCPVRGDST